MTTHHYEYDFPVPLAGSLEDAFKALTDADALRIWFAEHVSVDLAVGGDFRFWGRHTYGTPSADQASQKLVRIEPPNALAFSWRLLGQDSEVTLSLREEDGATRIKVSHQFAALPDIDRAEALIDDLWRIYTGNLCGYLAGQRDMFRADFNDPSPDVRCEVMIAAPPAKVFAVLITPEYIKQWFPAPAPVVEPRVGGDYGFGFSFEMDGRKIEPPPMKILEFVENERLAITWPDWRMDPSVPDQTVTWILEDLGDKTRLVLIHNGFSRTTDVSDYPFGWQEFMRKIGEAAEQASA